MSNRKAAGIIAFLILAAGIVVALLPVSISPRGVDIGCGDAMSSSAEAGMTDVLLGGGFGFDQECHDKLATHKLIAFPLIGVGAVGLLFALLTTDWKTASAKWDAEEEQQRAAARRAEQDGQST